MPVRQEMHRLTLDTPLNGYDIMNIRSAIFGLSGGFPSD